MRQAILEGDVITLERAFEVVAGFNSRLLQEKPNYWTEWYEGKTKYVNPLTGMAHGFDGTSAVKILPQMP